jgi:oligoendopeptidase F
MTDAVKAQTGAEEIVWDLSHLYAGPDDLAIEEDMQTVQQHAQHFLETYRGRVGELDVEELRDAMESMVNIVDGIGRLLSFASLSFSTDTANPKFGALQQKLSEFNAQTQQYFVFFDLEWNQLPEDHVQNLLQHPVMADYAHHLEAKRRYTPYQLPEEQEKIILQKNVTGIQAWRRFFTQLMGATRYTFDGEELTQSQILSKLHEADRDVREKAAQAITDTLKKIKMQTTYVFNVMATDKNIEDQMRGYESWVTARNMANKAPDSVVDALVSTVTSNYDLVARHYYLKRVLLGLDELADYDRYAPIPAPDSDKVYTWAEARTIVLNAFYAFSDEMGDAAKRFFDENWIHAALAPNKRGGAFAHPVTPSVHPYVFLNFTGKARDVMTLAHELGHGIHMLLSGQKSGIFGLYTPLTTAETASTFAEMLVFDDLLAREEDPAVKLSMLVGKIEDSFATIYRQIAMNRFEDALHTARRTEGELDTERINQIWTETQTAMFGDSVNMTDNYRLWWSYIPHFIHTPGYVYAYSFGELLVFALYNIYKQEGEGFAPKYIDVLAAGNSDYPDAIMAQVGVDLNDPTFWQNGIDALRDLIEQEEQVARKVYPDLF